MTDEECCPEDFAKSVDGIVYRCFECQFYLEGYSAMNSDVEEKFKAVSNANTIRQFKDKRTGLVARQAAFDAFAEKRGHAILPVVEHEAKNTPLDTVDCEGQTYCPECPSFNECIERH